jgi:hypothetical protein
VETDPPDGLKAPFAYPVTMIRAIGMATRNINTPADA